MKATFFDKNIDDSMDKNELLEVIEFLIEENERMKLKLITPEEEWERFIKKKTK